jgi:hypothetical protein
MIARHAVACCIVLVLAASANHAAYAENWVQAGPEESRLWYDADSIRPTAQGLIGVWISSSPNRTSPGARGVTIYPIYSIINCRERTAGSKLGIDLGQAPQPFAASTGMGELILKLCL